MAAYQPAPARKVAPKGGSSDPFGGLTGADRDVAVAIENLMKSYGLQSLAPKILDFVRQGYSSDTITILLQETPEYKQRFVANEKRKAAGLPVLSPAEYLSVEGAYREIMSQAGLPPGFYDQPSDFTKWIEEDVSPLEIKQRVDVATNLVNSIDPNQRAAFEQWYTKGDMVAYALDRKRATTVLERQYRASQVGGAAMDQGLGMDRPLAERIADTGVEANAARQGFGFVAQNLDTTQKLGSLYGEEIGQDDLVQEVFFDDAKAGQKRKKLASRERATFSGSSGASRTSLSKDVAGGI